MVAGVRLTKATTPVESHNGSSHFCPDRISIQTCLSLETAGKDVIVKTKTTK